MDASNFQNSTQFQTPVGTESKRMKKTRQKPLCHKFLIKYVCAFVYIAKLLLSFAVSSSRSPNLSSLDIWLNLVVFVCQHVAQFIGIFCSHSHEHFFSIIIYILYVCPASISQYEVLQVFFHDIILGLIEWKHLNFNSVK